MSSGLGTNSYATDDAYNLHSRVNTLKQIAIEIDGELANQRNLLNAMDNEFDSFGTSLKNSMNKLRVLIQTQSGSWVWILLLFVLLASSYIYFFRWGR